MAKSWFYRLLLSYLPIFVVVVVALLLVSFLTVSDLSKKSAVRSNEVFIKQVMQTLDNSLRTIDETMNREIFADGMISRFMSTEEAKYASVSAYDAAIRLKRLTEENNLIDSVYLVRERDLLVVTEGGVMRLDEFADRSFVSGLRDSAENYRWTGIREYGRPVGEKTNVVSLAKQMFVTSSGFMVVNVNADRLQQLLQEMSGSNLSYIRLLGADGAPVAWTGEKQEANISRDDLSSYTSPYTRYEIRSGVRYIGLLETVSDFTLFCIAAGMALTVIGIVWIVFVSRRNYKPMARIVQRLGTMGNGKVEPDSRKRHDEFRMIEQAIDRMAEESDRYEKQMEENFIYRRQMLFQELLEGKRSVTDELLQQAGFGLADDKELRRTAVVVAEIDGYASFIRDYSAGDQNLLKFVLGKTIGEITQNRSMSVGMDWVADRRLAIIVRTSSEMPDDEALLLRVCEDAGDWVKTHLSFTVTFGCGKYVDGLERVSESYRSALRCLLYKPSLGADRIITESDLTGRQQADMFRHVQSIRPFAQAYKLGKEDWREHCARFFADLEGEFFTLDDLTSFTNYTMYYFHREMMELAAEFRDLWEREAMPKLVAMLDSAETLAEMRSAFTDILTDGWNKMGMLREHRNNRQLLVRIREYIEGQYGNPDLSLILLSDEFGMNGKYLSRLFKDEFGVNFGDYLVQVRIAHAKRLLSESSSPIQEIAAMVGYTTSIAFIRVFKKLVGMTPGDYRKESVKP